jgi:hypothetical protein
MKLAGLVCAGGLALMAWGWRVVHTPLPPLAAAALERMSGLPANVNSVHFRGLALALDGVTVGPMRIDRILVRDRGRALLSGVTVGPFHAGEVGLELEHGRLKRAAFSGGKLGPLGELAGVAMREGDHISVRAARPGLLVSGKIGEKVEARIELEKLPLAGIWPRGLEGGIGSGAIELRRGERKWLAAGHLDIEDLTVAERAISIRRIEHLHPRFEGEVALASGVFSSEGMVVTLAPLTMKLAGSWDRQKFEVRASIEKLGCNEALTALRPLVPALDGMLVEGKLAGRAHVDGDREALGNLKLDLDLDVGCRVLKDAPLADLKALAGNDPIKKEWRRLSTLPLPVVRTFVAAEDARFFRHHGFDPEMIRHALAHDLSAGRIDKGASTITQQTVKNLFLSGERTLTRKLEEAVLAWRAEQVLDKQRILEIYLNLVELAPGAYGVAAGAERYFGKEPEELSADEGAQLAALLPAPRRGMDGAWEKRYQALRTRLPSERTPIQLTRR